jgi:stage II sporulation protein D
MKLLKNLLLQLRPHWWVSIVIWFLSVDAAQAAVEMRVAIKKNISQIQIGSSSTAIVRDATGRQIGAIAAMNAFAAEDNGNNVNLDQWRSTQLIIEPMDNGYVWIGDKWYRGKIKVIGQGAGITVINLIDLEEYLYSVVGAEAIPTWPIEALKAQAVAARTYALYKRSNNKNPLFDVDTTTDTQVYKGLNSEYVTTHDAVNSTRGEVLTYNGKLILAVFHSSSGGYTENVEDVWTSPLPYLRAVEDYDQNAPVFQWSKTFSPNELAQIISGVGNVKAMIPEKTTPRGRVVSMKVVGERGTKSISGTQLRQALELRSTLFSVSYADGLFSINGRGYGHGLGMSQWGSQSLAQQGLDYQQILAHYYRNVRLSTVK